jgi:hypothetical protein
VVPLTALNVIVPGDEANKAVPLPNMPGVEGVCVSIIGFQIVPFELYSYPVGVDPVVGEVKLIVNVPVEKVALVLVGVPGDPEEPPEVTVIELVGVPGVVPLTALNVIVLGDEVTEAVPLPGIPGVDGVCVSVMGFQIVPSWLYSYPVGVDPVVGEVKIIVNVPVEKVALVLVGVPGIL